MCASRASHLRKKLQASLAVATAVGGQNEPLALHGAVLLFAQRLQLSAAVCHSRVLPPPHVSPEQSKTWDTQEEGERPQAQSQTQVHCPAGGDRTDVRAEGEEEDEVRIIFIPGGDESVFHCWVFTKENKNISGLVVSETTLNEKIAQNR